MTRGSKVCGDKCKSLVSKLEKIERHEKKKKKSGFRSHKLNKAKKILESPTLNEVSESSSEEDSSEESEEVEEETGKGVETGGKISQQRLRLMEKVAKQQPTSQNPQCKKKKSIHRLDYYYPVREGFQKNPAYGRHQLFRPMRIVGPIQI